MDWLSRIYVKVESQKLELERVNKGIQTLFKVWPSLNEEKKSSEEKDCQQPKDTKVTDQSSTPNLTVEEKEGVDLVDKLLQKAQKARTVQKKLEEPKRSRNVKEIENNTSDVTEKSRPHDKLDERSKNGLVKFSEQKRQASASKPSQRSDNKPLNSNTKVEGKREPVRKNVNSVAAKNSDTLSAKNSAITKSNNRDGSASNKSAGRRVTPAHISAPFQTNPRLTGSKLRTEYTVSTGKVMSAARSSTIQGTRVKGSYSAPLKRSGIKETEKQHDKVSQKSVDKKEIDQNQNSARLSDDESEEIKVNQDNENRSDSSHHSNEVGDKLESPSVKDERNEEPSKSDGTESQHSTEENSFRLSKDGYSLNLPVKYRKLTSMNRKLRQKIYTQNVTKKVDSPQPSKQFPLQLHHTFGDPEIVQIHKAAKQAIYLVNVYRNLADLLDKLNLQNLSGDSPTKHVCFAKKSLEYILSTFHETETLLHSNNLGVLKTIEGNSSTVRKMVPEHPSLRVWYPQTDIKFSGDRALKYKSHKQVERYTRLFHHAQLLQLKIDSMDVLAQHTIPLLKSLQPDSSEFIQVLRSSYSLLSTNPNRAPVIVKDTILDDTGIQEPDLT